MFTLADCALRNVNATTVAASRHPDHHPEVTSTNPNLCGLPMVYQTSYELRVRLTVYLFRSIGDSRRSASPSASRSGADAPPKSYGQKKFVTIARISQISSANKHI